MDSPRETARAASRVPRAGRAARGGARHRRLRRDDLRTWLDQLGTTRRMAAHRPGVLLHLRPEAQPSEQGLIRITQDPIEVPDARRAAIERLAAELPPGQVFPLSTHINSD